MSAGEEQKSCAYNPEEANQTSRPLVSTRKDSPFVPPFENKVCVVLPGVLHARKDSVFNTSPTLPDHRNGLWHTWEYKPDFPRVPKQCLMTTRPSPPARSPDSEATRNSQGFVGRIKAALGQVFFFSNFNS